MANTKISPRQPHFFKFIPDPLQEISIPEAFIRDYLAGEKCSRKATLKTNRSATKCWNVSINNRCFKHGWKDFVRDHDLQPGNFLVFKHLGGFLFHVLVFDSSVCEREYPPLRTRKQRMKKKKAAGSMVEDQFTVTLTPANFDWKYLTIGCKFGRENGLVDLFENCDRKSWFPITVRSPEGKFWEMSLKYKRSDDSTYIRGGLDKFFHGNNLKVGDVCTFKLVFKGSKSIVMEVSVSRCKDDDNLPLEEKPLIWP